MRTVASKMASDCVVSAMVQSFGVCGWLTVVISRITQYAEFGIQSDSTQGYRDNRTRNGNDDDAIRNRLASRTRCTHAGGFFHEDNGEQSKSARVQAYQTPVERKQPTGALAQTGASKGL